MPDLSFLTFRSRSRQSCVAPVALLAFVWSLTLTLITAPRMAWSQNCAEPGVGQAGDINAGDRAAISVRLENDAVGGRRQDQNYTGGTIVTFRSPNLTSYAGDPCLPSPFRWINQKLTWLQPDAATQRNFIFGVAHLAFTPVDRLRSDLITDDRPYASLVFFSLGYNGRNGAELRTTQFRFGIVGPVTQGERVQNWYHDSRGLKRFLGWNNQLRNELLVQLVHERLQRWSATRPSGDWGADLIGHWGGAIGNLATYANLGAEWRIGRRLPDDFGSAAVRPAGDNTSPGSAPGASPRSGSPTNSFDKSSDWSAHLFTTVDVRGVLRDITFDGNSFGASHRIDKRRWVAELGVGMSLHSGQWKLAIARYVRTREFSAQKDAAAYGGITVTRFF